MLVWKNLGGVCFPAIACCLRFGSPPADGSCLVRSDMIATGFPRYKSRHGRGTDFDHHGHTRRGMCGCEPNVPLRARSNEPSNHSRCNVIQLSRSLQRNRSREPNEPFGSASTRSSAPIRTSGEDQRRQQFARHLLYRRAARQSSPASERRESNAAKGGTPRK